MSDVRQLNHTAAWISLTESNSQLECDERRAFWPADQRRLQWDISPDVNAASDSRVGLVLALPYDQHLQSNTELSI